MRGDSGFGDEPRDGAGFTAAADRVYTRFAGLYDLAVRHLPLWRRWLDRALPHIQGPRVLEVSFGTGYVLTRIAGRFECYGVDYNARMVALARRNLRRAGLAAELQRADVVALPYADASFDTVVDTMAFSGYPDAARAMAELRRVIRPGGRLVLIDVAPPGDGNRLGRIALRLWRLAGDIVRDLPAILERFGFGVSDREIGGWGSVHLYVATKR